MSLIQTVMRHAEDITSSPYRYVLIHGDMYGNTYMEIGIVREDGVREVPHATRKYFEKDGEVSFLTYPHC